MAPISLVLVHIDLFASNSNEDHPVPDAMAKRSRLELALNNVPVFLDILELSESFGVAGAILMEITTTAPLAVDNI